MNRCTDLGYERILHIVYRLMETFDEIPVVDAMNDTVLRFNEPFLMRIVTIFYFEVCNQQVNRQQNVQSCSSVMSRL